MPWGTLYHVPIEDNLVNQIAWKDNALVLNQSIVDIATKTVLRNRKRPSKTSTSAHTARVPFGDQTRKELPIPGFINQYNHNINDIDQGDQLQASYPGLRRCRRGGWQSLFIFLLNIVLVNLYLLSLHSNHHGNEALYPNQLKFRDTLIQELFQEYGNTQGTRKRSISTSIPKDSTIPIHEHKHVHLARNRDYKGYKGETLHSRSRRKRVALGQIIGNSSRKVPRTSIEWWCKQYIVPLCKRKGCFSKYHCN